MPTTDDIQGTRPALLTPALLRAAASVLSGVLLAASFPPFGAAGLAWVALVPILLLAAYSPPRAAFRWGFLAGFLFWLITVAWLLRLIRSGGPLPAVLFGWAALAAYCALYVGAFAMLAAAAIRGAVAGQASRSASPPPLRGVGVLFLLALAWTGLEYLRSTLFTGFAWNALGVSQYRNLAVIQVAEWGGVYAVSFLLAVSNGAVALSLLRYIEYCRRRGQPGISFEFTAAMAICLGALLAGEKQVRAMYPGDLPLALRVSAINPAIPQTTKWDEAFARSIQDRLNELTEAAMREKPDLVVWPETVTPYALRYDPEIQAVINRLVKMGAPLLAGSLDEEDDGFRVRYYNSAFLVATNATLVAEYRKQHLVPFGEYIPLDRWFPSLASLSPVGYSCSPGRTGTVFRVSAPAGATAAFAALICFEDTIAPLAGASVRGGARLLINLTNDAWFENSPAAEQHMSHCVFRCVENRVPAVRCANLGVTCFIDRTGAIDTMTRELLESGRASDGGYRMDEVRLPGAAMPLTLYTRFGDWLFALPCGAATAAALAWMMLRRNAQCLRN